MRRSKAEIYLHFVWAVQHREPLLIPELERQVHRCIEAEAQGMGCSTLAINGMLDHVHLAVQMPTKVSPAELMKRVKGVSSALANELTPDIRFRWQEGYAVFSIGRPHVAKVIRYIENQKRHHAQNTVWAQWEETDEEATLPPRTD